MKNLCFHIGYSVLGDINYGSEISLINLCRELKKFYNIVVFSFNIPVAEKIINNFLIERNAVFFDDYIKNNKVDILVISRYLNPFLYHTLNIKKIILWSHDTGFQSAFEGIHMRDVGKHFFKNIEDKISNIVCLTEFHADLMKKHYEISKPKISKIGHGIDFDENLEKIQKVKHRFIYTSYPNRGLDLLLKIFPLIRQEFNDAELHIYRDESTFSPIQNEVIEMCKDFIKKKGFVDNKEIQKAFREAEVWLYPTNFAETYCISALEAQANGCLCISSDLGSLNEIISDRGVLIGGEYGSKEYIEKILKSVRIFFTSDLYNNKISRAKAWAKSQKWENIAKLWIENVLNEDNDNDINNIYENYFDDVVYKTKIINLEKCKKRFEDCEELLKNCNIKSYERFNAINGEELVINDEIRNLFVFNDKIFAKIPRVSNSGIIGCALSHMKIWEEINSLEINDDKLFLIMEDDVLIEKDFKKEFVKIYSSIKNDKSWDILFLGFTDYKDNYGDITINKFVKKLNGNTQRFNGGGFYCYAIRAKGAKKILEIIKEQKINRTIDWYILYNTDKINCYICQPKLLASHRGYDKSNVQGIQKTLKF